MRTIGFLVNPCAGLGGKVGLKGTDGLSREAITRGAVPEASLKAGIALDLLKDSDIRFFTCSGEMGENIMKKSGIRNYTILYRYTAPSTASDTRNGCRAFLEAGAGLILFAGGDGTARDVFDVAGRDVPVLGIPAGVKMFSGVFAISPAAAAGIILKSGDPPTCRDSEVADIDEAAYREGQLHTRLYGIARVPYVPELTQGSKQVFVEQDDERAKDEIARFLGEVIADGTLTLLGPGTTTYAIAKHMGLEKTLLGFDAIKNGVITGRDLDEQGIIGLLRKEDKVRIIVSPIGAQGFVIGRGTQVISPEVIRTAGIKNLIVAATPAKLAGTPVLYVDTGDELLDSGFGDSISVISGYRIAQRKRLVHGNGLSNEKPAL